jgi:hypothetical protein
MDGKNMENEEIKKSLEELVKNGDIKHVGFKDGQDAFILTKKGILSFESKLAEKPEHVLFLLQLAYQDNNVEHFYNIINNIANLRKSLGKNEFLELLSNDRLEYFSSPIIKWVDARLVSSKNKGNAIKLSKEEIDHFKIYRAANYFILICKMDKPMVFRINDS